MREYGVTITGERPLLMHADNIEWSDQMDRWRADPSNKKLSKAGDDRSPAFRWLGHTYHDGKRLAIPADNIMRALMEGGALVPVPGAKNAKTFKSQSQSGCVPLDLYWPLTVHGKEVDIEPFIEGMQSRTWEAFNEMAAASGFMLYLKRAKIGQKKHIRVRPLFSEWGATGRLAVMDDQITTGILGQMLEQAGVYKGLGDWRPGGKTPGPYGTFKATIVTL